MYRPFSPLVFGLILTLQGSLASCQASGDFSGAPAKRNSEAHMPSAAAGIANPADKKCADDGYKIKPVYVNGLPVDSECVNPHNRKSCRAWSYYRNQCSL